jgi:PTH2 family peptidyl-tRNA hydrolase
MPDPTQPSTANVATACAIIGLVTGYLLGQAKSLGLFGGSPISAPQARKEKALESDESDESSDEDDGAPSEFPGHSEDCKLVLVVRTDLGMTKGTLLYPTPALRDC